ncbi:MAG: glycosyltransferase [Armatimonadetes bacterium]|nr:glycosyltransferase [Armatimonadota bacterium]
MKVLILTPFYAPEDFGAGVSITEMATTLAARGHQVQVLTLMPNYPKGEVFEGYRGKESMTEVMDGVTVERQLVVPAARDGSLLKKGMAAFKVQGAFLKAKPRLVKPDVILTVSPPPFAGIAAQKLAKEWGVPYVVRVCDIASHALAAAKASKNPLSILVRNLEAKMIRGAAALNVVSPSFVPELKAIGAKDAPIETIYDWADGSAIRPLPGTDTFRAVWDLDGKFVLMYSGSLGYTSDLIPVLEAIARMEYKNRLALMVLGAGPKLAEVKQKAAELGLENVRFRDLVPRSDLNRSLCAAHMHIATLTPEGAKSSTQGKMRTITAAGRGVIGVMPTDCGEAKVITEGQFGVVIDNKDVDGLARQLDDFCLDPELAARLGIRARTFFEANFELQHCVGQIESQLQSLVG